MSDKLTFGSLFAGIGGFDLGFERAGMVCNWQVECSSQCCDILDKHWSDVVRFHDVKTFPPRGVRTGDFYVDVLVGGFPCQDISIAGRKAGIRGKRSGLWKEYVRIIRLLRPEYTVVENVAAILDRGMDAVLGDLAESGYDAEWQMLSAADFGAPHERERLFLVAYPCSFSAKRGIVFNGKHDIPSHKEWSSTQDITSGRRWQRWLNKASCSVDGYVTQSDFCSVDDGIPEGLGVYGNAVLPCIAEFIGRLIIQHHEMAHPPTTEG